MPRKRKRPNSTARVPAPRPGGERTPVRPRADYDATQDKRKRQAPRSIIKSEDELLTTGKRRMLQATAEDQLRNFAVAAWMVRKHTSYVSRFVFHANTDDKGFERALEDFITYRSHASQFDAAGRLNLKRAMTMTERHAVVDGDHFWHLLRSGSAQLIQGDLVYQPHDLPDNYSDRNWVHGIEVDDYTKPINYCLCTRDGSSRRFGKIAKAHNVLARAYWPHANAVRGVSPLASALNTLQDLYEGFDYQLVKAKLHALFGVAILSDETQGIGGFEIKETQTTGTEADDGAGNVTHQVKDHFLKPGVASVFNLPAASKIEMLESKTPSGEWRSYSELMMQIAMLAVDLPYIFFNAKDGSFSIHRTARLEYEKSCKDKRDANIGLLDSWTVRQILRGIEDGEFSLPSGWTINDAKWEWVPESTPWFDELDEIDASIRGISAGLIDPYRWTKEHGHGDGNQVLDNIAKFKNYAESKGLQLEWAKPLALTIQQTPTRKDA
jgi:capsid protein